MGARHVRLAETVQMRTTNKVMEGRCILTDDDPIPQPCDPTVYNYGTHVATWESFGAPVVEAFVQRIAELSGQRVDWYYAAGRVIVKALGDTEQLDRVRAAIRELHEARITLTRVYNKDMWAARNDISLATPVLGKRTRGLIYGC